MNYTIRQEKNEYLVTEKVTGSVLMRTKKKGRAERFLSNLNSGTGFMGFTPNFLISNEDDRNKFYG